MEKDFINQPSTLSSMPSNDNSMATLRLNSGVKASGGPLIEPSSSGPSHHHSLAAAACAGSRILSRNCNGTIAMTSQPTNESELQLYRVLQRANLLSYYDTFICQGGDDVQQLCEAGEEEFLEIMALVGMASKPLHVRRLQKALQEWVSNPGMFQAPLMPSFPPAPPGGPPPPPPGAMGQCSSNAMVNRRSPINLSSQASPVAMRPSPPSMALSMHPSSSANRTHLTPSPTSAKDHLMSPSHSTLINHSHNQGGNAGAIGNNAGLVTNEYGQPASPISLTPILDETQIQRLADAAEMLVKSLPPEVKSVDPKLANNKKRISKELEYVMNMSEDDVRRMDEIRKYAAIYGRFDCKRKPEKPLTLHEVSVNEAAAQICKHIPALLTRRDELFPLARQVVRDSGYQYSKGHSRSQCCTRPYDGTNAGSGSETDQSNQNNAANKRIRVGEPNMEAKLQFSEEEKKRRQERLETIVEQLKALGTQQEEIKLQLQQAREMQNYPVVSQFQSELDHISTQQMQLINEQSEINKQIRRFEKYQSGIARGYNRIPSLSDEKGDTDDTDSQFSLYSNTSSPSVSQEPRGESPTQESSQNSDNFSKLLPVLLIFVAKKTGNAAVATQLTRQLVQETLIDEGLRVVKEYTDQNKDEAAGVDLRVLPEKSVDTVVSNAPPVTITQTVPTSNSTVTQNMIHHGPRPRGRPPKFLEREFHQANFAAYQSQLSQHLHQQYLSQNAGAIPGMIPANGFANIKTEPESNNGHNYRNNGQFLPQQNAKNLEQSVNSNDVDTNALNNALNTALTNALTKNGTENFICFSSNGDEN
ncbi:NGFI-A-binding protein 1-like isoform X2 [Dinothrombium tinctorium]|uniref:NGFI-A-binding protein 1-like isoform X2 n=1 Tax=Dinothrombium tinctorium TaxID=1965070 RepID=A0A3S3SEW3_9ACAR|nr:NGFI-A-binding protein 1-like isoform X2 [Dinothrombium tinctorium]RWS14395.1 NGFI-A-binding protein 1-like isoform X2 [Dinothrombium tinctorium]